MSNHDEFKSEVLTSLWAEMFIDDDVDYVIAAILIYLDQDTRYAPTIGEIKENMRVIAKWLSQKVSVKDYVGSYLYSKLPSRTRQYIEKVEASRIPEPKEHKKEPIKQYTDDGREWTAEVFFEKVKELMNMTGRDSLRMPD
ncbi:MAG: replicative helicase loader/inhibitor [Eubacteriaceae bacterium]